MSSLQSESKTDDALAHLAKMSGTGSAFGQAEYVAINTLSIAALVFGMVSLLSLVFNFFVLSALVGIVLGFLSLRQISHSNGTQSGRAFAIGGILVSLLLGGYVGAQEVIQWQKRREMSAECAQLLSRFGKEIHAEHYQGAYDTLMTDVFRQRVEVGRFIGTFHEVQSAGAYGKIDSIEWHGQPMSFTPVPDSSAYIAITSAKIKFEKFPELIPQPVIMTNKSGTWQIENIPRIFPEKRVKRGQKDAGNQ